MAYVGDPFRHDIFVSYSHGDVQRDGQALLKQWSQSFVEEFKRELQTFPDLGAQLSIFLDEGHRPGQNIDPMAPLSDALRTEVAGAAILAILMTPHYLGSKWCQQELTWWVEAQRTNKLAHDDRIAIARVWPTGSSEWPADLVDGAGNQYVGHHFFNRARSETRPQPFSWPHVTSETGDPFRDALLDFVGAIQLRLRGVRKQLELRKAEETALQRLGIRAGQVLYLHGRTSHAPIWERVHQELEDDGYTVFPMEPEQVENDPRKIRDKQKERISTMSGCDAMLLLGTEDVLALQADLMVIGRLDRHQAVAQSNRLLPCGVVDTVGVVRARPDWSRKAKGLGVDWIDASVPPWTPQVRTWLNGAAA